MNILCVLATNLEAKDLFDDWSNKNTANLKQISIAKQPIDVLITGIGIMHTTLHLTKQLYKKQYDLVINLGIAGSFKELHPIGTVLEVNKEINADLGTAQSGIFKDLFEMKLMDKNEIPYTNGILLNTKTYTDLPKATGITVNKVQSDLESIQSIQTKYNPDIESMEGAAVFYTCLMHNTPFVELRSISNKVEPYNKDNWDISLALQNLKVYFNSFINQLKL